MFPELNIPKTTTKNWIHRGVGEVVTNDTFDLDREALELKCFELEEQVKSQQAGFKPLKFVSTALGLSVQYQRFTSDVKQKIMEAIEVARLSVPSSECLVTIGLSKQKFSHWLSRMKACQLEDFSTCPKTHLTKIMPSEVASWWSLTAAGFESSTH